MIIRREDLEEILFFSFTCDSVMRMPLEMLREAPVHSLSIPSEERETLTYST